MNAKVKGYLGLAFVVFFVGWLLGDPGLQPAILRPLDGWYVALSFAFNLFGGA